MAWASVYDHRETVNGEKRRHMKSAGMAALQAKPLIVNLKGGLKRSLANLSLPFSREGQCSDDEDSYLAALPASVSDPTVGTITKSQSAGTGRDQW